MTLQKWLDTTALDRAVFYGILRKIWSFCAGPVTLLLIAYHFDRRLQGYYYTFATLIALQVFFELGIGQVILQFASHEWSALQLDPQGISGDAHAYSRLISIGRLAMKWYASGAALLTIGLCLGGYWFFSSTPAKGIHWLAPWICLSVLTGIDLFSMAFWSLLQGCNQMASVYFSQLIQRIVYYITLWILILEGAGLWVVVAGSFVGQVWCAVYLFKRYRKFFSAFLRQPEGPRVSWQKEMLPFQWRIGISWLFGFFMFSLFTPVLFKARGPVVAGQMGMTWALVSSLSTFALLWLNAKAPAFGMLVAKNNYIELDKLLIRTSITSLAVVIIGSVLIEAGVIFMNKFRFPYRNRLLGPWPTAIFLLGIIFFQIASPFSYYLRAHKKEPLMGLSVVSALVMAACVIYFAYHGGVMAIALSYCLNILFIILPGATWIWWRFRNRLRNGEIIFYGMDSKETV